MTAARIKELVRKAEAAQTEGEQLDAEIAEAIADGVDDETLADLRRRRRELVEQTDDVGQAITLLEQRANDPKIKEREQAAAKARQTARHEAEKYKACAAAVDEALRSLETNFEAMETGARLLQRALQAAGVSDAARMSNTLQPSLRWAMWRSAPRLAKAIGLSHTPFERRRTLVDNTARVIPNIGA